MADGNVFELMQGVLSPVERGLDYLFYAGVLYGAGRLSQSLVQCLRGVRTYLLPYGRTADTDLAQRYGRWAVITGATSGIGLAYTRELASRGLNVVLISKSYDELVTIVSDIQSQYSVQALGIHADFGLGRPVFQDIEDALQGYEIGILVNNVAIRYDHPQYFALVPHRRVWQLIHVNISATAVMAHMLLPQMLERRKGVIINVCSNAACTPPIPLTTGYTATMAYVDRFSQSLHHENKHRGVFVQTLLPCFVATEGVSPTLFTPSPSTYVRHALSSLGVSSRTCGYWPHALQSWLCDLLPSWLWVNLMMHLNSVTRKRCLHSTIISGEPLFARRKFSSAHVHQNPQNGPNGRRRSDATGFRRTPSPHRRVSTVEAPTIAGSPATARRRRNTGPGGAYPPSLEPFHQKKTSVEELLTPTTLTPSSSSSLVPARTSSSSSHGSIPMIPEGVATNPEIRETPSPSVSKSGGFLFTTAGSDTSHILPPRRSSSSVAVEQKRRSFNPRKQYSRVLVLPSVARVSHSNDPIDDAHPAKVGFSLAETAI